MINDLHKAILDLNGVLHSPRIENQVMQQAGVELDRALFPLLLRIGMRGPIGVVKLAEQVGRDHSTVSRQVAKLESLGLITRQSGQADQRMKEACITDSGQKLVRAIAHIHDGIVEKALEHWSESDREQLTILMRKLADSALSYVNIKIEQA
ncbi:MarR family transcriptional regulator [Microvirga sp. W0021]|uniref:MarR family transcriptional regulator n=1 Tax=Hohaiivirga grylli TaxID=3133970 RepID=A0ABV0BHV7_9HYPH